MAHQEQKEFCEKVKQKFPEYFKNKKVLDVGSLDINGNNRFLFEDCSYIGIDIGEGPNVDIVSIGHEFKGLDSEYDVIISTECFEHDMYYSETILNIVRMLKSDGIFIFTCASTGRPEHGTLKSDKNVNAPLLSEYPDWIDYYKNLTEQHVRNILDVDLIFKDYYFKYNPKSFDLYFYGIKR
jgi:hypothetical protein